MTVPSLMDRVQAAVGARVVATERLSGGQVGVAVRCKLEDGRRVVAKTSPGTPLADEGFMLRYLAERSTLPVPRVLHVSDDLLVESYVEGSPGASLEAERHAGRLLSELHGVGARQFGLERATRLGPFRLDNTWRDSWPSFYARQRLLPLAEEAAHRGSLPRLERLRVERLAAGLPARFDADPVPSLIHGDIWSGNVLSRGERITAFLDPAIYYADAEVELAFIDLFHTFGEAFYRAYQKRRPIDPGYARWRRALYQVVPLLVHVGLFGGSYLQALRTRLDTLAV